MDRSQVKELSHGLHLTILITTSLSVSIIKHIMEEYSVTILFKSEGLHFTTGSLTAYFQAWASKF